MAPTGDPFQLKCSGWAQYSQGVLCARGLRACPRLGSALQSSCEKQFEDTELWRAFAAPVSPGSWHLFDRQKGGCETVPNSANSHCTRGVLTTPCKRCRKVLVFIHLQRSVSFCLRQNFFPPAMSFSHTSGSMDAHHVRIQFPLL